LFDERPTETHDLSKRFQMNFVLARSQTIFGLQMLRTYVGGKPPNHFSNLTTGGKPPNKLTIYLDGAINLRALTQDPCLVSEGDQAAFVTHRASAELGLQLERGLVCGARDPNRHQTTHEGNVQLTLATKSCASFCCRNQPAEIRLLTR
jgi:hypothetical protein